MHYNLPINLTDAQVLSEAIYVTSGICVYWLHMLKACSPRYNLEGIWRLLISRRDQYFLLFFKEPFIISDRGRIYNVCMSIFPLKYLRQGVHNFLLYFRVVYIMFIIFDRLALDQGLRYQFNFSSMGKPLLHQGNMLHSGRGHHISCLDTQYMEGCRIHG